jgi:adenylate kinase family enzyme
MFEHGRDIDDAKLLDLILRRVQMRDCLENGWILENYPKTRA